MSIQESNYYSIQTGRSLPPSSISSNDSEQALAETDRADRPRRYRRRRPVSGLARRAIAGGDSENSSSSLTFNRDSLRRVRPLINSSPFDGLSNPDESPPPTERPVYLSDSEGGNTLQRRPPMRPGVTLPEEEVRDLENRENLIEQITNRVFDFLEDVTRDTNIALDEMVSNLVPRPPLENSDDEYEVYPSSLFRPEDFLPGDIVTGIPVVEGVIEVERGAIQDISDIFERLNETIEQVSAVVDGLFSDDFPEGSVQGVPLTGEPLAAHTVTLDL